LILNFVDGHENDVLCKMYKFAIITISRSDKQ